MRGEQARKRRGTALLWLAGALACGGNVSVSSDAGPPRDGSTGDVTVHDEGGGDERDSTAKVDSGSGDAGTMRDGSTVDSGGESDAKPGDSSEASDTSADAATEAASDSSVPDANDGAADAGRVPLNHRPDDSQCLQNAPAGGCQGRHGECGAEAGSPASDSLCTAGDGGRCNGGAFCACTYDTCAADTDCPADQVCACHGSAYTNGGNACAPGDCRVDSNCGDGGYCSASEKIGSVVCGSSGCTGTCGGGVMGYYCHTAADECIDDLDCYGDASAAPPSPGSVPICAWSSASSHWTCQWLFQCP